MRSNKPHYKFSASSIRAHILVPYSNTNEHVLRKSCCQQAQPEINNKDATDELVCSALTSLPLLRRTGSVLTTVTPWVEINPYFGRPGNSNVFGKKLSEMLKFPARESYCFTLIAFVLTRQETIKNNNTYCSRIQKGRKFWIYIKQQYISSRFLFFLLPSLQGKNKPCLLQSSASYRANLISHSDVNECHQKLKGNCSHLCVNTQGSYYCKCPSGFQISQDYKTCKCPEGFQESNHRTMCLGRQHFIFPQNLLNQFLKLRL